MADYRLARRFLEELALFEKSASSRDLGNLDDTLAAIVANPNLPGRVPSFYDPTLPSYLYRSGMLLIHYRVNDSNQIEFLNLFWPKVYSKTSATAGCSAWKSPETNDQERFGAD